MLFRFDLRDRRNGKIFERGQSIEAASKTEARKKLAEVWRRDTPRDARNFGYVPFRDCEIIWLDNRERHPRRFIPPLQEMSEK